MATTTVFVKLMGALMPILHTLVQNCNDVFLASAFDYHQVLYEKPVFYIPTTLQYSAARV